jgi:hypothetical protein
MGTVLWVIAGVAALYTLHRLGLWMEDRGWIYYRKKHGSSGTLGSALLEIEELLEPTKRHVIEARHRDDFEEHESGDPR